MTKSKKLLILAVALAMLFLLSGVASALVNLEWRPIAQTTAPGGIAQMGLYAVSDNSQNQLFAAMDVIILWDTAYLDFVQIIKEPFWFDDGFPTGEIFDINDNLHDGNAMYKAWAWPGTPVAATPQGLLCTTFQFSALAPVDPTYVNIGLVWSQYVQTIVFDAFVPTLDIKGTLGSAEVTIVPEPASLLALAAGVLPLMRRATRRK